MMMQTEWKEFRSGGQRYRIKATYGLDYAFAERNNQAPHFSVTGEIDRWNGRRWVDDSGGMIHGEISKYFKNLKPYLKWHLVSLEGPLHYIANAQYWWEKIIGTSKWETKSYDPDPVEAFKSTIIFGAVKGDEMPTEDVPWEDIQEWLEERHNPLMGNFLEAMNRLGVLE